MKLKAQKMLLNIPLSCIAVTPIAPASANEADLFYTSLGDLMEMSISSVSHFSEARRDAIATVSKVERDNWELWNSRHNYDALSSIAGVQASPSFAANALSVRGYTQLLSVRGILTLIDGVPVNDLVFGSSQYDQEHITLGITDNIELIRGPGSTQYGSDAFHGVLSFDTFYSEDEHTELITQAGSNQYNNVTLRSASHVGDHYLNLAVDTRQELRWLQPYTNIFTGEEDRRDKNVLQDSASLKWHNGQEGDIRYQLSAVYNKNDLREFSGGGEGYGYTYKDIGYSENDFLMLKGESLFALSDTTDLGVSGSHWQASRKNIQSIRTSLSGLTNDVERSEAKLFVKWQGSGGSRLYTAVERTQLKINRATTETYNSLLQQTASVETPFSGYQRDISSLVAQGRWQTPFKKLSIEAGARMDFYSDIDDRLSPLLGAIYDISASHRLKALYNVSYRAGVAQELVGSGVFLGNPALEAEQLSSKELSYIYSSHGIDFELAFFDNHWDDAIVASPIANDPVYFASYINSGENRSHGLETSAHLDMGSWQGNISYSLVHSENITTGQDYVAFPKWMLKTEILYQPSDRYSLALRADFRGGQYSTTGLRQQGAGGKLSTYSRIDLAYQRKLTDDIIATLTVKDIFNRENRIPSVVDNGDGEPDYGRLIDFSLKIKWQ